MYDTTLGKGLEEEVTELKVTLEMSGVCKTKSRKELYISTALLLKSWFPWNIGQQF